MVGARVLRVFAFVSLTITTLFWLWVAMVFFAVHYPNNTQQIPGAAILAMAAGTLTFALFVTLRPRGTLFVRGVTVLEGLSIVSLLAIVGAAAYVLFNFQGSLTLVPLSDILFPTFGLTGSILATLLYGMQRHRLHEPTPPRLPPSLA